MGSVGSRGMFEFFEDWYVDNISTAAADGIGWLNSSDMGDTAFARTVDDGMIVAQATTAATDDNLVELAYGSLVFRAQDGFMKLETKVSFDTAANLAYNIGFNDDALDDSNTLPVELATATFTSNAGTFIGYCYDVDATNDDVHAFWVDDDGDTSQAIANLRFSGLAPQADDTKYYIYHVECNDAGSSTGAVANLMVITDTGRSYAKRFTNTVDRDALLTPYIGMENRSASAHQVRVAYVYACKSLA